MNRKFHVEEKVRFQHCDFAGIVFYPRYFEMINSLIEDWFEALGLPFDRMHAEHYGIPTKSVSVTFKQAARLNERLVKELYVEGIGNTSVVLHITFTHHEKKILEGESVLVFVEIDKNNENLKPISWMPDLRLKMAAYLAANE